MSAQTLERMFLGSCVFVAASASWLLRAEEPPVVQPKSATAPTPVVAPPAPAPQSKASVTLPGSTEPAAASTNPAPSSSSGEAPAPLNISTTTSATVIPQPVVEEQRPPVKHRRIKRWLFGAREQNRDDPSRRPFVYDRSLYEPRIRDFRYSPNFINLPGADYGIRDILPVMPDRVDGYFRVPIQ